MQNSVQIWQNNSDSEASVHEQPYLDATKPLPPFSHCCPIAHRMGCGPLTIWAGKAIQRKNKCFPSLWVFMKGNQLPDLVHWTDTQGFALVQRRRWYRGRNKWTGNSTLLIEICTSQDFCDKTMNCTLSLFCIK